MVDRAPPSRFSVVERGGRLVVIDRDTGTTPLSAAERMDLHDRNLGVEPIRPAKASAQPDLSAAARAESGLSARPAPTQQKVAPIVASKSDNGRKSMAAAPAPRPTNQQPTDRPSLQPGPAPARIAGRPAPQSNGRKTIVTGKWWDAKGPRTIELGPKGQQTLNGGFITLVIGALVAAIATLFIQPVIFFIGAFVLFRFGGTILGPIGAGIVDKAIAERT